MKDKMTIDLAGTRYKYAGAKEAAIRDTFSENTTRFYQRLNRILDDPAALAYDAQLVNRLRRLRDQRVAQRTARARGFTPAD